MRSIAALLVLLLCASHALAAPPSRPSESTIELPVFGKVALYGADASPTRVGIFISGDGGWNQGVVDMARALAADGALVVGVDITRYLRALGKGSASCLDFAADFERLSQAVQKRVSLPRYEAPVLVGYSSGATLVYATLVQAPPNTFRGAISLGFCPDLRLPKPACKRGGLEFEKGGDGVMFAPAPDLAMPFVALQGDIDQVCDSKGTAAFVEKVGHGELVPLPKVGHGFSVPAHWLPQLRDSFTKLTTGPWLVGGERPLPGASVEGLPLVEVPAKEARGDLLAIVVSGDGGWASLDREVAGALSAKGIPVVGLDSLRYFWTRRTPDEASRDLARIAEHYLEAWQRGRLLLVGYSRGADVLPFMASRLPDALRSRVALVALLGPALDTTFEFHLPDWFEDASRPDAQQTRPEVEKLRGTPILCVYGSKEKDSLCTTLPEGLATLEERQGAHHFGGDYEAIADRILALASP
jgi:type IV secretory pathway VirJ component